MPGNALEIVLAGLDVEPGAVRAALDLLSEDERQRAGRFVRAGDRRRYAVARAELRRLLGARLQVPPRAVTLAYGRRGKPALAGALAGLGLQFNVSHHDGIAAYAFAQGREVGIDIEAVRAVAEADDIAARAFSPRERAAYFALDPRERPLAFFNCWTRKEAFIKAQGDGLSYGLDRFDVSLAPGDAACILSVDGMPGERCGWELYELAAAPGMAGAVVVRQPEAQAARDALPPAPVLHAVTEKTDARVAA